MNEKHAALCAVIGAAALIMLYYASQNDGPQPMHVPEFQTEAQFSGLGANFGGQGQIGPGGPLDMDPSLHFWAPGFGAGFGFGDFGNAPQQPVPTRHRYPCVSGGNITAVMHHGWSSVQAPESNQWFMNPPEVAVL